MDTHERKGVRIIRINQSVPRVASHNVQGRG